MKSCSVILYIVGYGGLLLLLNAIHKMKIYDLQNLDRNSILNAISSIKMVKRG